MNRLELFTIPKKTALNISQETGMRETEAVRLTNEVPWTIPRRGRGVAAARLRTIHVAPRGVAATRPRTIHVAPRGGGATRLTRPPGERRGFSPDRALEAPLVNRRLEFAAYT